MAEAEAIKKTVDELTGSSLGGPIAQRKLKKSLQSGNVELVFEALTERLGFAGSERCDDEAVAIKIVTVVVESLAVALPSAPMQARLLAASAPLFHTRTNGALRDAISAMREILGEPTAVPAGLGQGSLAATAPSFQALPPQSLVGLLECELFSPHLRRKTKGKKKRPELDLHKAIAMANPANLHSRAAEVEAERLRRARSNAAASGATAATAAAGAGASAAASPSSPSGAAGGVDPLAPRRRTAGVARTQLFHYKYYRDQVLLGVTEAEMDDVVSAVVAPPDTKTRLMASKVLLKILVDIYCTDDATAIEAIASVFRELLDGDRDSRAHAYNLLFNLAIHLYLFEESHPLQSAAGAPMSAYAGALARIGRMQDDLFGKLVALLAVSAEAGEGEPAVLDAALAVLLFFIAEDGELNVPRARRLAPGAALLFLGRLPLSPSAEAFLVRLLALALYGFERGAAGRTDAMPGAVAAVLGSSERLVALYCAATSRRAADDLFCVLFDYAVGAMRARGVAIAQPQAELIRSLLVGVDAPPMLARLFAAPPPALVESLLRHLFLEQLPREAAVFEAAQAVEKPKIVAILYDIGKLAEGAAALGAEGEALLAAYCEPSCPVDKAAAVRGHIAGLLQGREATERDRARGVLMLVRLFALANANMAQALAAADRGSGSDSAGAAGAGAAAAGAAAAGLGAAASEPERRAARLFQELFAALAVSGNASQRLLAVDVIERLARWRLAGVEAAGGHDRAAALLMSVLNQLCGAYATSGVSGPDRSPPLLERLVEILLRFIAVPTAAATRASMPDTLADAFVEGQVVLSRELVKALDVEVPLWAFRALPAVASASRCTLLAIIACKSSQRKALSAIGGMSFFTALLGDADPAVAYLAAQFLVEQLMSEKPEQYRSLLTKLGERWRAEGVAAAATGNEYLQITGILESRQGAAAPGQ